MPRDDEPVQSDTRRRAGRRHRPIIIAAALGVAALAGTCSAGGVLAYVVGTRAHRAVADGKSIDGPAGGGPFGVGTVRALDANGRREIMAAYADNPVVANDRYMNSTWVLRGRIDSIETNGKLFVDLGPGVDAYVYVIMNPHDIRKLHNGDQASITAKLVKYEVSQESRTPRFRFSDGTVD